MLGVTRTSARPEPLRWAWRVSRSLGFAAVLTGVSLGSDTAWSQPVRVFEQEIVRQSGDYDCGPAALATMMAAHSGADFDLTGLMARLGVSVAEITRIRGEGFSLEQLARLAKDAGAHPQVFRVSAGALSTLRLPVLVYLQLPTGPHFSLLTGLAGHHVALADPSQGRLIWPRENFLDAWAPDGEGYLLSLREGPAG